MAKEVVVKASDIKKRKIFSKNIKIGLSIILLVLIFIFIILSIIYKGGNFTITLDRDLSEDKHITIYDEVEVKENKRKLVARKLEYMDNISIDWIPTNIDNEADGSHNGENYIAYTFYIANNGKETIDYWYSVIIDDVIKRVDEAIRVMVYLNGEKTIYAKKNINSKREEEGTKAFYNNEKALVEERENFASGDVDKFTIVIWLEGDDPDCKDDIIGGEIKMHMDIREEHEINDKK